MTTETIGVVIGRFQVPELHSGHQALISTVMSRHRKVMIMIGSGESALSERNPMPGELRRMMLAGLYNCTVVVMNDHPSNEEWSKAVDAMIQVHYPEATGAILYGGRENNLAAYSGTFARVVNLNIDLPFSGTEKRRNVELVNTLDFRKGMIYAGNHRFPTSYQTVDLITIRTERDELTGAVKQRFVLMGRKKRQSDHTKYVFPGGFVDPTDASLEAAAQRELREEVGDIAVTRPQYAGSIRVDDWRYRSSVDKICTAVFYMEYIYGAAKAADDLDVCVWVPMDDVADLVTPVHQPVWDVFMKYWESRMVKQLDEKEYMNYVI